MLQDNLMLGLEEDYSDYKKTGEVISKAQLDEAIDRLLYSK